jgi:hypothetical protein
MCQARAGSPRARVSLREHSTAARVARCSHFMMIFQHIHHRMCQQCDRPPSHSSTTYSICVGKVTGQVDFASSANGGNQTAELSQNIQLMLPALLHGSLPEWAGLLHGSRGLRWYRSVAVVDDKVCGALSAVHLFECCRRPQCPPVGVLNELARPICCAK